MPRDGIHATRTTSTSSPVLCAARPLSTTSSPPTAAARNETYMVQASIVTLRREESPGDSCLAILSSSIRSHSFARTALIAKLGNDSESRAIDDSKYELGIQAQ